MLPSVFAVFISSVDQPSADGLRTYWVSKLAYENDLKVGMAGFEGDEFFAGYGMTL